VNDLVTFSVKTTEPASYITYQLYAKGNLLNESTAAPTESDSHIFQFSFPVTNQMAPNCRILAFYFREDGEVVADSLSFKVAMSTEDQVII
jgi:hypothetical protein